ncbi:hypothetical protein ACH9DO_16540 [Kocuria sp. M1N1S27]
MTLELNDAAGVQSTREQIATAFERHWSNEAEDKPAGRSFARLI